MYLQLPEIERISALPAVWYPGQTKQELSDEIDKAMATAIACQQFISGKLSGSDYLDIIESTGEDMDTYLELSISSLETLERSAGF